MEIIIEAKKSNIEASTIQYLCGPCAHYGGCK